MTLAILAVALAIVFHGWKVSQSMSNLNLSVLTAAIASVAEAITKVAESIRNPEVNNNDQDMIDQMAGQLESAAATLTGLASEEDAMDTGEVAVGIQEPTPEPETSAPMVFGGGASATMTTEDSDTDDGEELESDDPDAEDDGA